MASLFVTTDPHSEIDYSLVDGQVRGFVLRGVKLYDEEDGTAADGWREKLVSLIREQGLDLDTYGHGLRAFVRRLQDDGYLTPNV